MPQAFEYTISLVDKLTAPAKAASATLTQTQRATRDLTEKLGDLQKKFDAQTDAVKQTREALAKLLEAEKPNEEQVKKLTATLEKQTQALTQTQRAIRGTTEKMQDLKNGTGIAKKGLDTSAEGLQTLGLNAVKALGPIAAAVAALVGFKAVAETAIAASGHKMQILGQLEAISGSADRAKEIYDHTQLIADNLMMSQDKVQELTTDLLKARVNSGSLEGTITAINALEKGQGQEAASKLQSIIKGHTFQKTFQFSREDALGIGVKMQDVYKAIADQTHQGVDDVRKQMMYGQITAKEGLDALNKLVTDKNKAAVEIAKNDPMLAFSKFKETMTRLFEDIDFKPLTDAIKTVTQMFDRTSVTGKALKAVFETTFKFLGEIVKFAVPLVSDLIEEFELLGLKIYLALIPAFGAIRRTLKLLGADGADFGETFNAVWTVISFTVEKVAQLIAGVAKGIELIARGTKTIGEGLGKKAFDLFGKKEGEDAVNGLIAGIKESQPKLLDASKEAAQQIPDGVAQQLDMHSPSRVLVAQGKMARESVDIGWEEAGKDSNFGTLNTDVSASGSGASKPGASPAGGGLTVKVENVQITLPSGTSQEQAQSAYDQFLKLLEPLSVQLGQPIGAAT